MTHWRPAAPLANLRIRAQFLTQIRQFFAQHHVLEVETPLLATTTATDPHLESLQVPQVFTGDLKPCYLQTSPEFAMKRLLAAYGEPIYQIAKAFRKDEKSRRHNPEFTMLEWYQPGYSLTQLMDEVEALVTTLLGQRIIARASYRELFQQQLNIDPHLASIEQLAELACRELELSATDYGRAEYLDLLFSHVIEPNMKGDCFVYDFPMQQAALAAVEQDKQGMKVAKRFELFLNQMEIANGYSELLDADEQRQRFESDCAVRRRQGLSQYPVDEKLLAALQHGLPSCSGVAVGVDRLLMAALNASSIDEIIAFPIDQI